MAEFIQYIKRTFLQLLSLTFLLTALLLLLGKTQYVSGWLIGCAINLLYFSMLCSRSLRAVKMEPQQAFLLLRGGAFIRILMIVLMLIIVLQFPSVNIWAVVAGIMTYRFFIYSEAIYRVLRGRKNS